MVDSRSEYGGEPVDAAGEIGIGGFERVVRVGG